jgi:hypothetical protein
MFIELNFKFDILEFDLSLSVFQFLFPFSYLKQIINNYTNRIVSLLCIPDILLNDKETSHNLKNTAIFNAYLNKSYDSEILQDVSNTLISDTFDFNWFNEEQIKLSTKLSFPLKEFTFNSVDEKNLKTIILNDEDLDINVGERVLITNQYNFLMNDYYYVESVSTIGENIITLKNYIDRENKSFDSFVLVDGDRIYEFNILKIYYDGKFVISKTLKKKTSILFDCVNEKDYSINTLYKTKEACQSDFDYKGDIRTDEKTLWFKRCTKDNECEHYNQSKNKRRGGCKNGFCEQPVKNAEGSILFYGNDEKDFVFDNDSKDRIQMDLTPIINF